MNPVDAMDVSIEHYNRLSAERKQLLTESEALTAHSRENNEKAAHLKKEMETLEKALTNRQAVEGIERMKSEATKALQEAAAYRETSKKEMDLEKESIAAMKAELAQVLEALKTTKEPPVE